MAKGNQKYGTKLVIIDGQHRLKALIDIYENKPSVIKDLVVPVCILFAPNSTKEKESELKSLPTVPHVFRHLFIDVNKTVERVGGHFYILLSDKNLSHLTCRNFCDQLMNTEGLGDRALAVIEWNTKKDKESTVIQRDYSLSSIGVLDKALSESVLKDKHRMKYILNLSELPDELLYNEEGIKPVEWDRFSLSQKKLLEIQINKYLVPCLLDVFFKTKEYKKAFNIFNTKLEELKDKESKDPKSADYGIAIDQILNFNPIGDEKNHKEASIIYNKFEEDVSDERAANVADIIRYAIFQRSLLMAWGAFIDVVKDMNLSLSEVTNAFIVLIDLALQDKGFLFSFEQEYMQHSVFADGKNINAKSSDTRKALSHLLLAVLGNKSNAQSVVQP